MAPGWIRRVWQVTARLPRPRAQSVATFAACCALMWGVDRPAHRAHAARHKPRAWFDAKGLCVFPLAAGPLPRTRQQLADALVAGWHRALKFSPDDDQSLISVEGSKFSSLSNVRMVLAGGRMDLAKDNKGSKPNGHVEAQVATRDFELDGRPLVCDRAHMNVHLTADRARLDLEHDQRGRPVMMLADARDAHLDFGATRADLERIVLISAREAGKHYGVKVDSVSLKLEAETPRSISLDLHLSTKVGFIPAGMRFQAHVDIDNDMNARLSNLKCDGDEALGPLIVGLIRPGLAKYEGRSKPVFSFPTGQLKLHDIAIQTGDDVHVQASFGG